MYIIFVCGKEYLAAEVCSWFYDYCEPRWQNKKLLKRYQNSYKNLNTGIYSTKSFPLLKYLRVIQGDMFYLQRVSNWQLNNWSHVIKCQKSSFFSVCITHYYYFEGMLILQ